MYQIGYHRLRSKEAVGSNLLDTGRYGKLLRTPVEPLRRQNAFSRSIGLRSPTWPKKLRASTQLQLPPPLWPEHSA